MMSTDLGPPGPAGMGMPVLPAMDNTLGALLIGAFCAFALWGLTCAQTWSVYHRTEAKDTLLMKYLIACLFLVDTLHTALLGHVVYFYLITNYMHPEAMARPTWSIAALVLLVSICDFIIRGLFCQRIHRFSGNNFWLSTPIMIVSFADAVIGTIIFGKALTVDSFLGLQNIKGLFYANFATGITSDLAVAIAMCALLYKSRTGIHRTDSLLTKLMVYSVNSGLIVAIDAATGMFTYLAMPGNFVFIAFYCVMSKLYLNSYLALLNARDELRIEANADMVSNSLHISSMFRRPMQSYNMEELSETSVTLAASEKRRSARRGSAGSTHSENSRLEVNVHTMVKVKRDNDSPLESVNKEWP